jgi:hypothetical protein
LPRSARLAALAFAGRGPDSGDVAVIRQNTTDAISYLASRLGLSRGDVVVTTTAEHHPNLLPGRGRRPAATSSAARTAPSPQKTSRPLSTGGPRRGCWRSPVPAM